ADGIRSFHVTGVQTCALPIFRDLFAVGGLQRVVVRRGLRRQQHLDLHRRIVLRDRQRQQPQRRDRRQHPQGWRGGLRRGAQENRSEERRVGREGRSGQMATTK